MKYFELCLPRQMVALHVPGFFEVGVVCPHICLIYLPHICLSRRLYLTCLFLDIRLHSYQNNININIK